MENKKRLHWMLGVVIAVAMLIVFFPMGIINANATDGNFAGGGGTTGDVHWHYDGKGTLTIFGSGDIPDYANTSSQPWAVFSQEIERLVIERGLDEIGNYAFAELKNLKQVDWADSIRFIGKNAFYGCSALTEITLPLNLWKIEAVAFGDCTSLKKVTFQGYSPQVDATAFQNVIAEARYPVASSSWTEKHRQNYGGTLTWVAADAPNEVFDSGAGAFGAWGIRNDGTLIISAESGSMWDDYTRGSAPWYKYRNDVTKLEILGYDKIPAYAFAD
jgi:hypothetical protein